MTDNQKIAYEWAKSHDYPSIAARYARELAGLVDDLQGAYDAMARDLAARTRQVRQLQGESAALRQQDRFREITKKVETLTLDELREMDGEPVFLVDLVHKSDPKVPDLWGGWIVFTKHDKNGFIPRGGGFFSNDGYGKTWLAYRHKPEEELHQ